jgi:hypothetical protein
MFRLSNVGSSNGLSTSTWNYKRKAGRAWLFCMPQTILPAVNRPRCRKHLGIARGGTHGVARLKPAIAVLNPVFVALLDTAG